MELGNIIFGNAQPGQTSYSDVANITNNGEGGVELDLFIGGDDFQASQGGRCPNSSILSLENFRYYAIHDNTQNTSVDPRAVNGYVAINKSSVFQPFFYNNSEIIQTDYNDPYWMGNILQPGQSMHLTFRLDLPDPCIGNFDEGAIYFWSETI